MGNRFVRKFEKGIPKDKATEDIIFYRYNKNYKPSIEERDKKRNLNGEITKTKIPRFNNYDEAMNFRNNYKENEKGGKGNDKERNKK